MNVELKEKYNEALAGAFARLKKAEGRVPLAFVARYRQQGGVPTPKHGPTGPKSGRTGPESGPTGPTHDPQIVAAWLVEITQKELRRQSLLGKYQLALANDTMRESILREIQASDKKRRQDEADSTKMLLPGFEHLPPKIGGRAIGNVTIKQFVAYADKYEARIVQREPTAEDIERLLKLVKPLNETEPKLTLAEAIARTSRGLTVIAGGAGK